MHSSMLCFLILLLLQFIQYLHMNDTGHGNLKCPVDYVGVVFLYCGIQQKSSGK